MLLDNSVPIKPFRVCEFQIKKKKKVFGSELALPSYYYYYTQQPSSISTPIFFCTQSIYTFAVDVLLWLSLSTNTYLQWLTNKYCRYCLFCARHWWIGFILFFAGARDCWHIVSSDGRTDSEESFYFSAPFFFLGALTWLDEMLYITWLFVRRNMYTMGQWRVSCSYAIALDLIFLSQFVVFLSIQC